MARFPARRLTLEEAAADPNNIVMLPAESGLRFPVVIYGGGKAIGEAFGELALQRKEKSTTLQADCQELAIHQPETI